MLRSVDKSSYSLTGNEKLGGTRVLTYADLRTNFFLCVNICQIVDNDLVLHTDIWRIYNIVPNSLPETFASRFKEIQRLSRSGKHQLVTIPNFFLYTE